MVFIAVVDVIAVVVVFMVVVVEFGTTPNLITVILEKVTILTEK